MLIRVYFDPASLTISTTHVCFYVFVGLMLALPQAAQLSLLSWNAHLKYDYSMEEIT